MRRILIEFYTFLPNRRGIIVLLIQTIVIYLYALENNVVIGFDSLLVHIYQFPQPSGFEQFKEFSSMLDVKSKLNQGTSSNRSNEGKVLQTINYFGNSVPAYRTATRQ